MLAIAGSIAGCGSAGNPTRTPEQSAGQIERSEEAAQKLQEAEELNKDRELLSTIEAKKQEEVAEEKAKKIEAKAKAKAKKREAAATKKAKQREKAAEANIKKQEAAAKQHQREAAKKKFEIGEKPSSSSVQTTPRPTPEANKSPSS